jgi:hypothetical protein
VPADASGSPWNAVFGLLLDRSFGLSPFAPVFLLALAGVPLLRSGRLREESCGRSCSSPWPSCSRSCRGDVVGVGCPPARLPGSPVPSLAVPRAAGDRQSLDRDRLRPSALAHGPPRPRRKPPPLAVLDPGRLFLLSRANLTPRLWEALAGEASPARYLPSLTRPDPAEWRVLAVWVAVASPC